MSAPKEQTAGFLLVDKPAGITSHDVVDRVRRITGERRVGHAGTLDPFATGLLIVGVGREATKRLGEFLGQDKEYVATAALGAVSDTQDRTGAIETLDTRHETRDTRHETRELNEAVIREAMRGFIGEIGQVPPMYSAKKIAGKKLYELARAGQTVQRKPVRITVYEFELLCFDAQTEANALRQSDVEANAVDHPSPKLRVAGAKMLKDEPQFLNVQKCLPQHLCLRAASTSLPHLTFRVLCSSGTYVRTLAHDLGQKLGCGAYLEELRRTAVGSLRVEQATKLDELTTDRWHEKLRSEV